MTRIQTATARSGAKRGGRRRIKTPVGIAASRLSSKSRATGPRLAGAGHQRGLKRSQEITDGCGRRAGDTATWRSSSDRRKTRREGSRAAGMGRGTGREPAAPNPAPTGRGPAGAGATAERPRGAEAVQVNARAQQWKGGAGAGRGEERRPGEGAGAERGGAGAGAVTELTEDTDPFV